MINAKQLQVDLKNTEPHIGKNPIQHALLTLTCGLTHVFLVQYVVLRKGNLKSISANTFSCLFMSLYDSNTSVACAFDTCICGYLV